MFQALRRAVPGLIACMLALSGQAGAFGQKTQVFVTASLVDKRGLFIENLEKQEVRVPGKRPTARAGIHGRRGSPYGLRPSL